MFWQYLQNGSLIMPYTEAARNMTFAHWFAGYGSHGVRAVWLDETEPDRDSFSYGSWNCEWRGYSGCERLVYAPVAHAVACRPKLL